MTIPFRHRLCCALAGLAIVVCMASTAFAQKPARKPSAKPANVDEKFAAAIRAEMSAALDGLQKSGDFEAGSKSLVTAFDQVIAYGSTADKALFRDAAFAVRLVQNVAGADAGDRVDLVKYLLNNPDLARALMFLIQPKADKPAATFKVLNTLRAGHADQLEKYANLAAALCVVHDRPLQRQINENSATAPDPVSLFEYFVANESRMYFGLQTVPAELLIYVVDSTASIDEMNWALQHYTGDQNVGARFFDIKYDYDYLRQGDTKKVTAAGWNLPNILKYGGVCADQAYFAVSIGKAIGVPTAYTRGASGESSHAWVGFLQSDGKQAWWNFDSGRYEVYQGVRGVVQNPQTRKSIPDSEASLLAEFISAKPLDRQAAAALTDAAQRLIDLQKKAGRLNAPPLPEMNLPVQRSAQTADALKLLQAGLEDCPGYAGGWFAVRQLAADGKLSLNDKKKWESVLYRLCGERYPDFYLAILGPMIETVTDVKDQDALWNAAFANFPNRADLAASVRMQQAAMWMKQKDFTRAGQCYEDVIARFANAGPFVLEALIRAEKILRDASDDQRILALYDEAWSQIKKPRPVAAMFFRQSNYYRVGDLYAKRLEEAGRAGEAAKVRSAIEVK